jgi:hypothetical protein
MANKLKSPLPTEIQEQDSEPVSIANSTPKKSEKVNNAKAKQNEKAFSFLDFFTDGRAVKISGLLLLLCSIWLCSA